MLINQRMVRRTGILLCGAALSTGTVLAVASARTEHSGARAAGDPQQPPQHQVPPPQVTVQPAPPLGGNVPKTPITLDASTVRSMAVSAAEGYGDPTPVNIVAVKTTRGHANEIMEPGLPSSSETTDPTPVILVTMTGSFTAKGMPIPPGAAVPTGTTLTIAYDATTGQPLDSNLRSPSNSAPPPDLAAAGTPELAVANSASADRMAARRMATRKR